jgi:hypothetical protein
MQEEIILADLKGSSATVKLAEAPKRTPSRLSTYLIVKIDIIGHHPIIQLNITLCRRKLS